MNRASRGGTGTLPPLSRPIVGSGNFPRGDPVARDAKLDARVVLDDLAHGHVAGIGSVAFARLPEALARGPDEDAILSSPRSPADPASLLDGHW